MNLGLSCSQGQSLKLEFKQRIALSFGETSGEIPIYSLHRIKYRLQRTNIKLSRDCKAILIANLLKANQTYRQESGNDWNCLTSNNLLQAIEATENQLQELIDNIKAAQPKEAQVATKILTLHLKGKTDQAMETIKHWFHINYDDLLYDMNGKIPWAIIKRLRQDLGNWVSNKLNPFAQNIEDMVLEVATAQGLSHNLSAEEAWEQMGGTVFTKKD